MGIRTFFFRGKANRAQALERQSSVTAGSYSPRYREFSDYMRAYREVPWVRPCVSVLAFNAANVELQLVLPGATDADDEVIAESALLDLLSRPNPDQSGFALFESTHTDLELCGNCWWALEGMDGLGRPSELYRLYPPGVQVLPSREARVGGYRYTVNGRWIDYAPEEMLHLRYPNPLDDHYGMGTIEAFEHRANSAKSMSEHEAGFWRSGGKITGVITTDQEVDEPTWKRIVSDVRSFFRGAGFSTLVLEQGFKYQSVSDTPAKLGLLEMAKASRDEILAAFGVPPTKVGILENANYKAQSADAFFWTEAIDPRLTRMEQALQPLVERFHPGEGLVLRFKRLNFEDDLPSATVAKALAETGVKRVDELRTYLGDEPVGGEIGASLVVPVALVLTPAPASMPDRGVTLGDLALVPTTNGAAAKRLASQRRPAVAHLLARRRDTVERHAVARYGPRLGEAFAAQERRVLAALERTKRRKAALRVDDVWSDDDEDAALGPVLGLLHDDALDAAYGSAAAAGLDVSFDVTNPRLADVRGTLAGRVRGINQTTRDALDATISDGLQKGYSTKQIADGVPDDDYGGVTGVFAQAKGYRAELISRTESLHAYGQASILAYQDSGVVDRVELLDGTGDPECAARNGLVVSLGEAQGYLADEHPQGTLALVPLVGGEA